MNKIVTIHQPDFLPYYGFFDRWKKSDIFIILDDVKFIRRGWHHRDKIKTQNGIEWLSIPIIKKGKYDQVIKDVLIDINQNWKDKHLKKIELAYCRSTNFHKYYPEIKNIYNKMHSKLIDINMDFLIFVKKVLHIQTPFLFSSEYSITSSKSDRLVELIKKVSGTSYLTGVGSKEYLDEKLFVSNGIHVKWQQFEHPLYNQVFGDFCPNLSIIDYIFNCKTL